MSTAPNNPTPAAPAAPAPTPPPDHLSGCLAAHLPAPLPPEEEALFQSVIACAGQPPAALAASLRIPYSTLLRWLHQPHIQSLLDQHHALAAVIDANTAHHTKAQITASLKQDFEDADSPTDRRLTATPLLRSLTPTRPATLRARAGAAPVLAAGRGGGAGVPPAAARASDPAPAAPSDANLPDHVARALTHANDAVAAFTHSPPRISSADFLTALAAYAETWEVHHAWQSLATPNQATTTEDAPPLAQPAPSTTDNVASGYDVTAPPITSSPPHLFTPSSSPAHLSTSAGSPAAAAPSPQSPSPSPYHRLTVSPSHHPTAAKTIETLHTSLRTHHHQPLAARQAFLDAITQDFTHDGRPIDHNNKERTFRQVIAEIGNSTLKPKQLDFQDPAANELAVYLAFRRGDIHNHHNTLTLVRESKAHPWKLKSIIRGRPNPPNPNRKSKIQNQQTPAPPEKQKRPPSRAAS